MSLLPISLGVRRTPDAGEAARAGRLFSKEQIEKTLWRDGFSCRCCGFTSKKFQRAVPAETSGSASDAESLITVCTFCEHCLSLDRAGLSGGGTLLWLPEIAQADLNHIARALYVAIAAKEDKITKLAVQTLEALKARRLDAKKRLGTDDPLILATALEEGVDEKTYAARKAKLEGIRLLPADRYLMPRRAGDVNIFPQMIAYWTSDEGPFGGKPVSAWTEMFEDVQKKAEV